MSDKEKTRGEKAMDAIAKIVREQVEAVYRDVKNASEEDPPSRGETKIAPKSAAPKSGNGADDPGEVLADLLGLPR